MTKSGGSFVLIELTDLVESKGNPMKHILLQDFLKTEIS